MGLESPRVVAHQWLARTWADKWLAELRTTADAVAAVRTFDSVDDLRTVDLAREALRLGMMQSVLLHVLLVRGGCVGLKPFDGGVPLGPLAAVQVYSSNALGRRAGKAHGPGCQHHRELCGDDDLVTLEEWMRRQ